MNKVITRWLPSATLFAWSFLLLYFFFSGRIRAFLHPSFRVGVLIAGLAILVLAIGQLLFQDDDDHCHGEECCHSHEHTNFGRLLGLLVLLLPVGIGLALPQDAFGVNTMLNRGIIGTADKLKTGTSRTAPQRTESAVEVLDLLYAAQDETLRAGLENRTVELIGQLMPDSSSHPAGRRFKVVRMFMVCCAADARPIAALVEPATAPSAPEMSWVKVTGRATFPVENGRMIAVLKAESIVPTDPPEETMLY